MLEKLNFNLKSFSNSEKEFDLTNYNDFISDTMRDSFFYNFKLNTPFIVHLVDADDNVFYHSNLLLISFEDYLYYDTINKSYNILRYNLEQYAADDKHRNSFDQIYISIYIAEQLESKIDTLSLCSKIIKAEREIQKVYRDVKWFEK